MCGKTVFRFTGLHLLLIGDLVARYWHCNCKHVYLLFLHSDLLWCYSHSLFSSSLLPPSTISWPDLLIICSYSPVRERQSKLPPQSHSHNTAYIANPSATLLKPACECKERGICLATRCCSPSQRQEEKRASRGGRGIGLYSLCSRRAVSETMLASLCGSIGSGTDENRQINKR